MIHWTRTPTTGTSTARGASASTLAKARGIVIRQTAGARRLCYALDDGAFYIVTPEDEPRVRAMIGQRVSVTYHPDDQFAHLDCEHEWEPACPECLAPAIPLFDEQVIAIIDAIREQERTARGVDPLADENLWRTCEHSLTALPAVRPIVVRYLYLKAQEGDRG